MKKKIENDWTNLLVNFRFTKRQNNCWSKLIGPVLVSIWYTYEYGTEYRVNFSLFNLSNPYNNVYACFLTRPKTRRSSITWIQHEEDKYKEAIGDLQLQIPISIIEPVTFLSLFDAYKNFSDLDFTTDSRYFEDPALIAAWSGNVDFARQCLDWGRRFYEKNCSQLPDCRSTDEWYQWMLEKISDPEKLRQTVNEQIAFHKLTKLPYEELIIDI